MPRRNIQLTGAVQPDLAGGFARIREEMRLPVDFPPVAAQEAAAAAKRPPPDYADRTDVELITIDPATSMDLDQAMRIEEHGDGHRVWYAIADVGGFVTPGSALDDEAHRRGETVYLPDGSVPLHPRVLSEGAASLLPGRVRPAALWRLDLDGAGELREAHVERALVRSRERFDYTQVQQAHDAGTAEGTAALLKVVGERRRALERARGGVSLPSPEQEVVCAGGAYRLLFRFPLPAETWNAQISLLTGMAAARMMLDGGVGVLRVLPRPAEQDLAKIRRTALALGVEWRDGEGYGDVVARLDPSRSRHAAFLQESMLLLRGSGYAAFDGEAPELREHAAVAAPYAHVTAPLRRLVDRYATEVCLALAAGEEVPEWVRAKLPGLPGEMQVSGRRAGSVERAAIDLVEATLLAERVGEEFDAVVIDVEDNRPAGRVQLAEPAVVARCTGENLPLGEPLKVRLTTADPVRRAVEFTAV
ncbi:ribonuclease R [Actinorhabdospora filicis]|uniref:Ribonuclease R n=1 Tax=Actinorhabdospora filicis TaxID=1785913 RepID=A0A9W6SQ35_9ACTN|nr:RNB domain-containing ribonuclease [Actinorhabdospora filicis]GLZ80161.1 ribonuclease R [Actinorhabdospora filicis]